MRIDIQKIKAKNFFSIGNNGIEFDYRSGLYRVTGDNKDSTGRNGAGKSVVLCETLAFGFYGKPIRKITKDEILNSTNDKSCEVEIYFKKEKSDYIIKRGIKPNFVQIYKNGELQDENANMKTTQREIERILGSDYQTFTHLLVMSNSYSTPFMDLDSSKKRSIIEDVLGISILGKMSDMIKKDYVDLKGNIKLKEKESEYLLKSYNELKEYHNELRLKSDKFEEMKQANLLSLESKKNKYKSKINSIKSKLIDTDKLKGSVNMLNSKLIEFSTDNKSQHSNINMNNKHLNLLINKKEKLVDTPVCPLCNTETNSEHIQEHLCELDQHIKEYQLEIENSKTNICKNNSKIEKVENKLVELKDKISVMSELTDKLNEYNYILSKIEHKLELMIDDKNTLIELINEDKELVKLNEYTLMTDSVTNLHGKLTKLTCMKNILSDDGIKNYIIKKVIKFWNMKVNQYLSEMNVNFSIVFDENLDSVLKSRNRDVRSYHNFSGGERSRIDVAILLAMLDLSRLQNNIDLNLMVIDELFDSAIDTNGREEILNLFKSKSVKENKSIYVISHSADLPVELFDKEITIYKKDGFTYI